MKKKLAFCITCMNRLHHLKQTLIRNIEDNYLINDIEFILLDYSSSDGLEEWAKTHLKKYIDEGILVYFRTVEQSYYQRSHSRNMAFRLANSDLVCNLDADNFLGKGFAQSMLDKFKNRTGIFCTSNNSDGNVIGRICLRKSDFSRLGGYNEIIKGYGFEDTYLFYCLREKGLKQEYFNNPEFYSTIQHSNAERVSEEYMAKNSKDIYLSYITPYLTGVLLLYNNGVFESGTIIDNEHINHAGQDQGPTSEGDPFFDDHNQISIKRWNTGYYKASKGFIYYFTDKRKAPVEKWSSLIAARKFYIVKDIEFKLHLIALLTKTKNFYELKKYHRTVGAESDKVPYGQGTVYMNFDYDKKIILE